MVEPDEQAVAAYAQRVRAATGHHGRLVPFAFGDTPALADELAHLVRHGDKRATAGWLADEAVSEDPHVGDHWIIIDGRGAPVCAIATTEVSVRPFAEVDPAFAWDEGEGDRTLEDWRDGHRRFFERRARHIGRPFGDRSPVRLERFRLVDPDPGPPAALSRHGEVEVRILQPGEREWVRVLLGRRAATDEVMARSGGFTADACPGLVARAAGRTAGTLVFRPRPDGVETVALVVLDETPGVAAALEAALEQLTERYGWRS